MPGFHLMLQPTEGFCGSGAGSLVAIVMLLLWHFRAVAPLLLPLVSIGTGILLALTVSLQVFGQIHIITLAFGAGLVGVSPDEQRGRHRQEYPLSWRHFSPS